MKQPPPDPVSTWPVPAGHVLEWVPVGERCRVATDEEHAERKCRRPGCQRAPVAALDRGYYRGGWRFESWWLYCEWHLYGMRIRNGRVEGRRAVPVETA